MEGEGYEYEVDCTDDNNLVTTDEELNGSKDKHSYTDDVYLSIFLQTGIIHSVVISKDHEIRSERRRFNETSGAKQLNGEVFDS